MRTDECEEIKTSSFIKPHEKLELRLTLAPRLPKVSIEGRGFQQNCYIKTCFFMHLPFSSWQLFVLAALLNLRDNYPRPSIGQDAQNVPFTYF